MNGVRHLVLPTPETEERDVLKEVSFRKEDEPAVFAGDRSFHHAPPMT